MRSNKWAIFSWQPFAWDVMMQKCLNNNDVSQYRHDSMIYSTIHNFMSNICYFTNMALTQLMNLGGCFTNLSRALQNNLVKIYSARNHIYGEIFKLKFCMCTQSIALGTHTKFQLEILMRGMISAVQKFQENILQSSWNVSETPPGYTILSQQSSPRNLFLNAFLDNCTLI